MSGEVERTGHESPEDHPAERLGDRPFNERLRFWWGEGRGYRDLWLIAISALLVFSLMAIQDQRATYIRDTCEDTNERNIETKDELEKIVSALPAGPPKRRARERQAGTELLIDALVPIRNCEKRVHEVVGNGFP